MVANLNCDAGYTNATAFFSSKLIVDNKGGSIYVWSKAEYGNPYPFAVMTWLKTAWRTIVCLRSGPVEIMVIGTPKSSSSREI